MLLVRRSERSPRFGSGPPRSRRTISVVAVGGVLAVGAMPAPVLFTTTSPGTEVASIIGEQPGASAVAELNTPVEPEPDAASSRTGGPIVPTGPTEPTEFELAVSSVEIHGTFGDDLDALEENAAEEEVEERPRVYTGTDGEAVDVERLQQWLTDRNSPLAAHAEELVDAGVEHDVDPRLVVGIAAIESSAGLRLPPGTHNAWGWSGDGPHGLKAWSSWPEAIHDFTERLARHYDTDSVDERLARKYVPPNWEKWLYTVRWVMEDI